MTSFTEDLRKQRNFITRLTALTMGALALGAAFPFCFAYLGEKFPLLKPFLSAEGRELGANAVYLPAGMLVITIGCIVLEVWLLGYEKSTLKRILVHDSASVRTDVFFLLFRISGLMMVFALLFSLGGLFYITEFLETKFGFATMKNIDSFALQFMALAVLFSFINYWAHRLLHTKILWEIHQVHHSAEELNVLLPYRNHPVDFVLATFYGAAVTAVLGLKPDVLMAWLAINAVYQSFVHSNYDWKWKWLEYLLITPAAHRIHHSTNPEHYNANLGIFSIWDRLFGTYIPPISEAIKFGVPDQENFNTDRFFAEIFACLMRWIGLGRFGPVVPKS